jgi:hypothetical protein
VRLANLSGDSAPNKLKLSAVGADNIVRLSSRAGISFLVAAIHPVRLLVYRTGAKPYTIRAAIAGSGPYLS